QVGLRHRTPPRIQDAGAVVVTFLDVRRVRALHERDVCLIGDRAKTVVNDLESDRIERRRGYVHEWISISRLPAGSTVRRSPGNITVVVSICSMTAGPEIR